MRVAATSSAVPTATICWSFDRAEHKKRAVDKDDGAFCAAGPEKSSGDCYFSHVDAVREMNGWSIESRRKVVGAQ